MAHRTPRVYQHRPALIDVAPYSALDMVGDVISFAVAIGATLGLALLVAGVL